MKIRFGFVSNSSSSSFLVCGTSDADLINSVLMKNDIIDRKINNIDGIMYDYYIRHRIEDILGLEVHRSDYGRVYLCKSLPLHCNDVNNIQVNINQVKELINSVENILSDVDPSKIIVDYIEEEY